MDIGIAFDLKPDHRSHGEGPDDRFEEFDSEETVQAIARVLESQGHRARALGSGRPFLERVLSDPPDLVFNFAEGIGTRSREAHVPAVCEMLGIPITHSDPLTLAVTLDKAMAKRLVASFGIPTPRFAVVDEPAQAEDLPLELPLIAKPLFEGSSMGIRKRSRVTSVPALRTEVERLIRDYREPVLVEEFCAGPELTVGVLGSGSGARVISAMEIAPKIDRVAEFVYSLEVKRNWEEEVEYFVPPRLESKTLREAEEVALAAHRALGCRDVSRVDVRLDARGRPRFLEANPLPGLNPVTGDLVILSERSGLPYADLIAQIVAGARERYGI
jgi:D-alanine-D-alanine ligase